MKDLKTSFVVTIILFGLFSLAVYAAPDPSGATLTPGASSRGTNPAETTVNAQAGNVTALNIDQTRITEIWQGFYGNVSGKIVLENALGNTFYDWTAATITGEVYATRNTVPSWSTVQCSNITHWELEESVLNISATATDGINETYSSTSHPNFLVGTQNMAGCPSTRPYNSTGLPGNFWNVMISTNTTNVVYTAVLADGSNAFDNTSVAFEILVPTNKLTGFATYYFYVELN